MYNFFIKSVVIKWSFFATKLHRIRYFVQIYWIKSLKKPIKRFVCHFKYFLLNNFDLLVLLFRKEDVFSDKKVTVKLHFFEKKMKHLKI